MLKRARRGAGQPRMLPRRLDHLPDGVDHGRRSVRAITTGSNSAVRLRTKGVPAVSKKVR